jgi:hypothetical protein
VASNTETWGREKARSRYAGSGNLADASPSKRAVERADGGGLPVKDSPPIVPSPWGQPPPIRKKADGGGIEQAKKDVDEAFKRHERPVQPNFPGPKSTQGVGSVNTTAEDRKGMDEMMRRFDNPGADEMKQFDRKKGGKV